MKFTLVTVAPILSALASGLALPDLTPRGAPIRPAIAIVIKEDFPNTPFPPTNSAEVSGNNGVHNVRTLIKIIVPACNGMCTINFSDASTATGSRRLQLFTINGYPANGNTWNSKPFTDIHKGTFITSNTGGGPATVLEGFGLTFPCPISTTTYQFELQPDWDDDSITWDTAVGGLVITCG